MVYWPLIVKHLREARPLRLRLQRVWCLLTTGHETAPRRTFYVAPGGMVVQEDSWKECRCGLGGAVTKKRYRRPYLEAAR